MITVFNVDIPTKPVKRAYSMDEANNIIETHRKRYEDGRFKELAELVDEATITEIECGFMTYIGYTDRQAYEIVRVISDKTIEVRRMNAKLLNGNDLNFQIGGFSAHCVNQHSQQYEYSSNKENDVIRVRKCKDGYWKNKGSKFSPSEKPSEFYDYNF